MIGPSYTYRGAVVSVHDGDTYVLSVDVGFDIWAKVHVRLHGWSCPELGTEAGARARDVAVDALTDAPLVVRTYKGQTLGRWIADVYLPTGQHLGEVLERAGVARPGSRVG